MRTITPQHHPVLLPWRSSQAFDDDTTAGAQKSRCAQLGCRVSGQAADQNNISRIVSWEIDNGARRLRAMDLFSRKAAAETCLSTSRQSNVLD